MKTKILLAAFLIACSFTNYAQKNIPKGSLLLGGDLSFSSYTFKEENNPNSNMKVFSISPSFGIAVKENLFIGLNAGFNFRKSEFSNAVYPDSSSYHGYSYGVFVRKYKPLNNNFYIFLQGSLGGSNAKSELEDAAPTRQYYRKYFSVNASITPGISYAINSKLQLETGFNNILGIGYSRSEYRDDVYFPGVRTEASFNAFTSLSNFSSSLYFGFRLLLQKKGKQIVSSKTS